MSELKITPMNGKSSTTSFKNKFEKVWKSQVRTEVFMVG